MELPGPVEFGLQIAGEAVIGSVLQTERLFRTVISTTKMDVGHANDRHAAFSDTSYEKRPMFVFVYAFISRTRVTLTGLRG